MACCCTGSCYTSKGCCVFPDGNRRHMEGAELLVSINKDGITPATAGVYQYMDDFNQAIYPDRRRKAWRDAQKK